MPGNPCLDTVAGVPVQVTFTKPSSPPQVKTLVGTIKVKNSLGAGWMTVANLAALDIALTPPATPSAMVLVEGSPPVYAGSPVHLISDSGYTATLPAAVAPATKVVLG